MTWGDAIREALGAEPMSPDETSAAWFAHLTDILDELAAAGRSQWEGLVNDAAGI